MMTIGQYFEHISKNVMSPFMHKKVRKKHINDNKGYHWPIIKWRPPPLSRQTIHCCVAALSSATNTTFRIWHSTTSHALTICKYCLKKLNHCELLPRSLSTKLVNWHMHVIIHAVSLTVFCRWRMTERHNPLTSCLLSQHWRLLSWSLAIALLSLNEAYTQKKKVRIISSQANAKTF